MNNLNNKISGVVLACSLSVSTAFAGILPESNACSNPGVVFVFFNGVQTTSAQAYSALQEFKRLHGEVSAVGDEISYEYLYNYTEGFEDFVETFAQRLLEQEGLLDGRYELFFEALSGGGSWWDKIIESVPSAASILKGIVDWAEAFTIQKLTTLFGNPPTSVNYTEHQSRIDNWILEGKKLLFVAHSQGNLFANAAYNYALTRASSESVKVVHIAPASPTLNGEHTLADLDLVINGLRALGSVASVTDNIPGYLLRPAGITGSKDPLGHGLLEIYINQDIEISSRVKSHIETALTTLIPPPAEATSGFFTATLTWDGAGDVDLHTFEPNGSHVFYRSMTGQSGYLDVDNTQSYGPEHYFASCETNKLQSGTYRISLANYSRADGRNATVQIASWNDGVLGTKSVTLGEATGDNPTYTLFNVVVTKDENTEQYKVSLGQ